MYFFPATFSLFCPYPCSFKLVFWLNTCWSSRIHSILVSPSILSTYSISSLYLLIASYQEPSSLSSSDKHSHHSNSKNHIRHIKIWFEKFILNKIRFYPFLLANIYGIWKKYCQKAGNRYQTLYEKQKIDFHENNENTPTNKK